MSKTLLGLCQQQLSWHTPGLSAGSSDNWKSSTVTLTPTSLLFTPLARVVDGIEDNGHTFHFNVERSGPKASAGGSTQGRPSRDLLWGSPSRQMAGGKLKSSNCGYNEAAQPPSVEMWAGGGMKWGSQSSEEPVNMKNTLKDNWGQMRLHIWPELSLNLPYNDIWQQRCTASHNSNVNSTKETFLHHSYNPEARCIAYISWSFFSCFQAWFHSCSVKVYLLSHWPCLKSSYTSFV